MTPDTKPSKTHAAWDKTKGKVNEIVGKMRDEKTQEMKGKAQQVKGEIEEEAAERRQD